MSPRELWPRLASRFTTGRFLWRSGGLALAAGVLHAASLALPFDGVAALGLPAGQPLWWLQSLAMFGLVLLLRVASTPRQAAWLGWLFATAWLAGTFAWLYVSMHTYGGLPAVLAALAVLALAGTLAVYYALAMWAFKVLAESSQALSALVFAFFWLAAELARGTWLTGFGWGSIGYAHVEGPLAPLLPWLGSYGVGVVAAYLAAWLALVHVGRKSVAWSLLVLACVLWGLQHVPLAEGHANGALRVTLLQGNIAQEEKFQPQSGIPQALGWYGRQLINSASQLVITPETALPVLPDQLPATYWSTLQTRFGAGEQAALVGVPLGDFRSGYTNSVVGFKPGQAEPWRYNKHHLVPFGEFIPPLFRWFTDLMQIPLGDFARGGLAQPTFDWQGQRLAVSICFENLFGEELATQFVDVARAPTMLVNVSNLGWFGEHLAMDQHLAIARVRALEFARPFLLATNTGRTAIVDHRGQVVASAPSHQAAQLDGEAQGRAGNTPYANWVSRWGLWPLWGLVLLVGLLGWGAAPVKSRACNARPA